MFGDPIFAVAQSFVGRGVIGKIEVIGNHLGYIPYIPVLLQGLLYGVKETDCCGCDVVKCLGCQPPSTSDIVCSKAKPEKCYTYNPQAAHAEGTGCWESACPENASDAPADEVGGGGEGGGGERGEKGRERTRKIKKKGE